MPVWDKRQCRCGALEQDACCCCPTCFTPQGDESIPTNGCEDDEGCGINRYMESLLQSPGA